LCLTAFVAIAFRILYYTNITNNSKTIACTYYAAENERRKRFITSWFIVVNCDNCKEWSQHFAFRHFAIHWKRHVFQRRIMQRFIEQFLYPIGLSFTMRILRMLARPPCINNAVRYAKNKHQVFTNSSFTRKYLLHFKINEYCIYVFILFIYCIYSSIIKLIHIILL